MQFLEHPNSVLAITIKLFTRIVGTRNYSAKQFKRKKQVHQFNNRFHRLIIYISNITNLDELEYSVHS